MSMRQACRIAAFAGVAVSACNALWGVDDLSYDAGAVVGGATSSGGAQAGGGHVGAGGSIGGGGQGGAPCLTCSDFVSACATASCPDASQVCTGASTSAWQALAECVCTNCLSQCGEICGAGGAGGAGGGGGGSTDGGTPAECQNCLVTAVTGPCSAEYASCTSN
jgi:hypothetical protein